MSNKKYDDKDIDVVDKQIAVLMECKPLPESEVRALSDKVTSSIAKPFEFRRKKS